MYGSQVWVRKCVLKETVEKIIKDRIVNSILVLVK